MFKTKKSLAIFIILDILCLSTIIYLVSNFSKNHNLNIATTDNNENYEENSLKDIDNNNESNTNTTDNNANEETAIDGNENLVANNNNANNNLVTVNTTNNNQVNSDNNTTDTTANNGSNNAGNNNSNNGNNTGNNSNTGNNNGGNNNPTYIDPSVTFSKTGDATKKITNSTAITVSGDYKSISSGLSLSTNSAPTSWTARSSGDTIVISGMDGFTYVWIRVEKMSGGYSYFKTGSFDMCVQYPTVMDPIISVYSNGAVDTNTVMDGPFADPYDLAVYNYGINITLAELKIKDISYSVSTVPGYFSNYQSLNGFKTNTGVEQKFSSLSSSIRPENISSISNTLYFSFRITNSYGITKTIEKSLTFVVN